MSRGKSKIVRWANNLKIVRRVNDLKSDIELRSESKVFPVSDLIYRASDTRDFLIAVNGLIQKALIIPSCYKGKCQEGVYLANNKNKFVHIGYKEGKDYLLDRDLVYNEAMKITDKKYEIYCKSKRMYFWDLLCDKVIKPHRKCYVIRKGKKRPCICVPHISYSDWYEFPTVLEYYEE